MAMRLSLALLALLSAFAAQPASAQVIVTETVEETVTYTDGGSERFVASAPAEVPQGVASFGPFRVIDPTRAAALNLTAGEIVAALRAQNVQVAAASI